MAVNETVGINLVANTKSLRAELREATQELLRLQNTASATSSEISAAARRAAVLKERISDAKDTIAAFNPEAKFKAFGAVVQGVAGAFAATQGAMALLGIEGEGVTQTLLKVQGALALSEGLNTVLGLGDAFTNLNNQVKESSSFIAINSAVTNIAGKVFKLFGLEVEATSLSFRGLKLAIAATGLGVLVLLLGEVVTAFTKFTNSAQDAKKAQDAFNKSIVDGAKVQKEAELDSLKRQEALEIAKAKRRGATEEELFAITDKFRRFEIRAQERFIKEIANQGKETRAAERDLKNLSAKRDVELINNETEIYKRNKDIQTKANEKALAEQTKANQEALAQQEKDFDEFLSNNEKRIARLNDLEKGGKTDFEAKLIDLKIQYDEDLKLFGDNESAKILAKKSYDEAVFKATKEEKERILKLDDEYADLQIEKLDKIREKRIAQETKTTAMITSVMDKAIVKQLKTITETDNRKLQFKEKSAQAEFNIATNLGNLLQQIAGQNKELAIAGVVVSQAASIAKIIQNTQIANAEALVLSPLTGGQPLVTYNYISMGLGIAASVAAGVQAIQQINSAGSGGGGGGGGATGGAGGAPPMVPRAAEPTATVLDQKSLNTINNVVSRAYVVESDITGSQQRISRIEKASRF